MVLLFLESVGTTELLLIMVVALIIFGPRKLPELSRSLGKGLSEFRRASDEFKRTWEREVDLERYERQREVDHAMVPEDETVAAVGGADDTAALPAPIVVPGENTIARSTRTGASVAAPPASESGAAEGGDAEAPREPSAAKSEWV
jgi:TatA/E family protein of Tat protein translocase